jgi:hypothetical protein
MECPDAQVFPAFVPVSRSAEFEGGITQIETLGFAPQSGDWNPLYAFCPSFVPTGMNQPESDWRELEFKESVPVGRFYTTDDIQDPVCHLFSSDATLVGGQMIVLSRGQI